MDKLSESLLAGLALVGGFITKRIFNNHDALSDRVSGLEQTVVTKADLKQLLDPIERNVEMIVTHLITSKGKK